MCALCDEIQKQMRVARGLATCVFYLVLLNLNYAKSELDFKCYEKNTAYTRASQKRLLKAVTTWMLQKQRATTVNG